MPKEWRLRALGTLLSESRVPGSDGAVAKKLTVRLHGKGVVAKQERQPGSSNTKYYRRFPGQLLYSKLDFLNGAVAIIPPELEGRESTADLPAFDLGPELDSRWLLAFLSRPSFRQRCGTLARGSRKALRLGAREFLSIEVPLPPLAEQERIAALLERFDVATSAAMKVLAGTRQLQAQMLMGFLSRGITKAKAKDSGLGKIPRDWQQLALQDLEDPRRQCVMTGPYGALLQPKDYQRSGVGVLKIGNLTGSGLDLGHLDYVSQERATALTRYRLAPGDLVIARQGATTGKVALVQERCRGYLMSYHLIRIAVDHARCLPGYLEVYFRSPFFLSQLEVCKRKGTREGVNSKELRALRMALPPLPVQAQIVAQARRFSAAVSEQELAIRELDRLKARVLEDLMTGRVRIDRLG